MIRCASLVLAFAIGLPLAIGAFVAAILAWVAAFEWLAAKLGWSLFAGEMLGLAVLVSFFGAAMGAASCRRAA